MSKEQPAVPNKGQGTKASVTGPDVTDKPFPFSKWAFVSAPPGEGQGKDKKTVPYCRPGVRTRIRGELNGAVKTARPVMRLGTGYFITEDGLKITLEGDPDKGFASFAKDNGFAATAEAVATLIRESMSALPSSAATTVPDQVPPTALQAVSTAVLTNGAVTKPTAARPPTEAAQGTVVTQPASVIKPASPNKPNSRPVLQAFDDGKPVPTSQRPSPAKVDPRYPDAHRWVQKFFDETSIPGTGAPSTNGESEPTDLADSNGEAEEGDAPASPSFIGRLLGLFRLPKS